MEHNPHIMLTPTDFTDTGQWRLIIYISSTGMNAYLLHLEDKSRPILRLLSTTWSSHDQASLLNNIESAIYDNPRLLDDYATDIVVETPQVCFVPNDYLLNTNEAEPEVFSALFPGESREVISDPMASCTALFSLVRGLDGFFSRTLPGARIRSHLAVLTERFSKAATADSHSVFADIRKSELDLMLFKGKELLSASVQNWETPDDVIYRIFNMLNAYGVNPALTKVNLSGDLKCADSVINSITPYVAESCLTSLPMNPGGHEPMPLAALLLAYRN